MQKADIEPAIGRTPGIVILVETVIEVNGERCWLFDAIASEISHVLPVRLYSTRNWGVMPTFLRVFDEKHDNLDTELFSIEFTG